MVIDRGRWRRGFDFMDLASLIVESERLPVCAELRHAGADYLFAIVRALNELCAILGAAGRGVFAKDRSALRAVAAIRQAPNQVLLLNCKVQHGGFAQRQLLHEAAEERGLGAGARIAVQDEASGAVGLLETPGHHTVHEAVVHQSSRTEDAGDLLTQTRTGRNFGPQQVARGDFRNTEFHGEFPAQRSLARTRRPQKDDAGMRTSCGVARAGEGNGRGH